MTNNVKKIERFEKRVKTIEEHLAEIKQQVDADKRQKEHKEVSEDISLVKEEITEHLDELKKDVDENADEIKKLEDLSKKIDSFSTELDGLKDEILKKDKKEDEKEDDKEDDKKDDKKEKKEEKNKEEPSFFANIFYGGLIANTLGNLPLIGKSIKSWTDKKLKESSQDAEDEESGKKEKPGFFKRIFKGILWSGIATGALWLGRKIIPDEWTKEVKSWLPWTDEAKAKKDDKEQEEKAKKEQEEKEKTDKEAADAQDPLLVEETKQQDESVDDQGEKKELTPEEQKATEEVKRMYSEGYSELYIVMKMYGMGFIPKFNMDTWKGNTLGGKVSYIAQGGPFTKMLDKTVKIRSDMHKRMIGNIKYTQETLLQHKLTAIKDNNLSLAKEYDTKIDVLKEMNDDLSLKKINSLDAFEKKYGRTLTEKFGRKNFAHYQTKIEGERDRLVNNEQDIKLLEKDIDKLKNEAKAQLDDLEKKAKADPKQKAKFQAEAKKIVGEYNKKIIEAEQKIGTNLSKVSTSELIQIQKKSPIVGKIMKINNGIDNFAKNTKAGKFMIGISVLGLVGKGVSGQGDWEQVGLEAADLATGMVPFAGGAYDFWTSITGKGIAGELGTTDRWIRGATGAVSVVLDVAGLFTFGLGNGASAGLKAAVRGGTKIGKITKIAKGVKTGAEVLNTGMKLATYGVLGYTLFSQVVPVATWLYETTDKKLTSDIEVK